MALVANWTVSHVEVRRPRLVGAAKARELSFLPGKFDAAVFRAFIDCVGIYPVGSLVRLASQRVAIVAEQSEGNLVAPVVMAFYSLRSQLRITPQRVDLAAAGCSDRIVGRHTEDASSFGNLDELWADPDLLRRRAR